MMRKIMIVLLVTVSAVWVLFSAAGVVLFLVDRVGTKENIQIYTETEPIYNHFPDLPETSEIQWCSRSSGEIGLTTTTIYFFASYDYDVSNELQEISNELHEMKIGNPVEDIALHFIPDGVSKDEKWRYVENAGFAFQKGIKDTQKMYTDVYINEAGTILYIEAIGN